VGLIVAALVRITRGHMAHVCWLLILYYHTFYACIMATICSEAWSNGRHDKGVQLNTLDLCHLAATLLACMAQSAQS
jgi:hypothetical protein